MQPSEPPAYLWVIILVGFPIAFVGMWTFVCLIISSVSGWSGMAKHYPCPEGLQGTSLSSGFANMVGVASYRGVLSFEATPQGLIARVSRLFPLHPALLIPWGAVRLQRSGGFFHAGEMQVAHGSSFRLNNDALTSIEGALAMASGAPAPWGATR
jgi:hypothetical protein